MDGSTSRNCCAPGIRTPEALMTPLPATTEASAAALEGGDLVEVATASCWLGLSLTSSVSVAVKWLTAPFCLAAPPAGPPLEDRRSSAALTVLSTTTPSSAGMV